MANVTIDVAAQFKGKPAFDKADNAVGGLEKSAKKLAKQFAGLFAVNKIVAFGKASVKAFEEDQKSAALLANTMKNLGMQFASPVLETYIAQMSKATAVADDELRPAMQKLLTTTGDYFKSQEILNQAIEVSRGSGVDLTTVTQDLASAYVGNTKGLKKYNLGLTQAQLKTMKFADIQKKLTAQFNGSNAAYLKTYAGQMQTLTVAAGEAKETIGKGLIESLSLIASDGSVQNLADSMQTLADNTANVLYGFGTMIQQLKNMGAATPSWLQSLLKPVGNLIYGETIFGKLGKIAKVGEIERNKTLQNPSVQMFMTDQANQRLNNIKYQKQQKLIADQLKATKALTAEQKKQAALKKAGTVFDLEQIQLVAALKGKLSDQEKLRVEAQLALLNGNDAVATKLTNQILASQDATGNLAKLLTSLPNANNPFQYLDAYLDNLKKKAQELVPATGGSVMDNYLAGAGAGNTQVMPQTNAQDYSGFALPTTTPGSAGSASQFGNSTPWAQAVNVYIDGKQLTDAVQNQALNGNTSVINRSVGAFDR